MTSHIQTGHDVDPTSVISSPPSRSRHARRRAARRFGWLPLVGLLGVAAIAPLPHGAGAEALNPDGLAPVCKNGGATGQSNFVFTAHDGYILTPDGNSIYMWSYSNGSDAFQSPGPALCVTAGDNVTITLQNSLPVPTSLNVVGMTGTTFTGRDADGTPSGTAMSGPATPSAADLAAGNLGPSVAPGATGTYRFVAAHAGTYLYESGTSPELQDQMGLVGALIVRPKGHPDYVYDPADTGWDSVANKPLTAKGVSTQFNADREFLHMLSEVDPDLHACFEAARFNRAVKSPGDGTFNNRCNPTKAPFTYDMTQYRARYWFINGRAFPDTVAENSAAHLPAQPYSALVHVTPRSANDFAPAVVRYLNSGPMAYPFHPHAQHEMTIGQDAQPRIVKNPDGTISDLTDDHFGITVAPGETLETFFSWVDAVGWDPASRPIAFGGTAQSFGSMYQSAPGVIVPHEQNKVNGEFWSGTPYLGKQHQFKPGEQQFNVCGEYYDVAHSHALYQVTNFGAGVGGMLTMIRIDPIGGCK